VLSDAAGAPADTIWSEPRCGHVGCCDSSKNQHASKHYLSSDHPVIDSFEPGDHWRWCYPDKSYARLSA
jgi:hypothetical protein